MNVWIGGPFIDVREVLGEYGNVVITVIFGKICGKASYRSFVGPVVWARPYILLIIERGSVCKFVSFSGKFVVFVVSLFCKCVCFFISRDFDVGSHFMECGGLCSYLQHVSYSNESILVRVAII